MDLSEVAYKAAEIISERGLAKGWLIEGRKVCNNGALMLAMGVPEEDLARSSSKKLLIDGDRGAWDQLQRAELTILAEKDILTQGVSDYNDLESTSAEDVILLLKETGKKLEC